MDTTRRPAVYHAINAALNALLSWLNNLVVSMTRLRSLLLVLSLIAPFLVLANMIVGVLISII